MANDWLVPLVVVLHAIAWGAGRVPPPWPDFVGVPLVALGGYAVGVGCGLDEWQAGVVAGGLAVLAVILRCFLLNPVGLGVVAFAAAYQLSHDGSPTLQWALGLSFSAVVVVGLVLYAIWRHVVSAGVEWWTVTLQTSLIGFGIPLRALFSLQWLPPFDYYILPVVCVFGAVRYRWLRPESVKDVGFEALV